ncbi:hypothetical protein D3C87_786520 [compost metagenome]
MSLKGINKRTVANLIGLLDQLEELDRLLGTSPEACDEVKAFKQDLNEAYRQYERMLSEIAVHVSVCQAIYNKIRLRFIPEKLKGLRRTVPQDSYEFILLRESIRKSHLI